MFDIRSDTFDTLSLPTSMPRIARIIVPGLAHHVTQRGNRREPIFFEPGDQEVYRDLLAAQAREARGLRSGPIV